MTAAPLLSVVVPSVNGWADLEYTLAALESERASVPLEVLIPERCGQPVRDALARRFGHARVIPVAPNTSIPRMRAIALAHATAPTVAVIEDHVAVTPGWASKFVQARDAGARAIGGGIENAATSRTVDWAAFLCEYSHAVAPQRAGSADAIAGNNTAYDRQLLEDVRDVIAPDRWEDALHAELRRRGETLWHRPDIVARHKKHFTIRGYASQRFLYSRSYAGARTTGYSAVRRMLAGAAALTLPPLLLARIFTRTWRGRAHRSALLRSAPLLLVFVVVWSVGEAVGSWFGAGDALARVK